jgi:hypothetical protein
MPSSIERGVRWYLGTVYVRFSRPDARDPLGDADLDRVADVLIALDDVATVRVEPGGRATVLRVDVRATAPDEAAELAVRLLEQARRELELDAEVVGVAVQ